MSWTVRGIKQVSGVVLRFFESCLQLWKKSLHARSVVKAVAFASLAILITGGYVSMSIANDLYRSGLELALLDSSRATANAQLVLNAYDYSRVEGGRNALNVALQSVENSTSSRLIAAYRVPEQERLVAAPPDRGVPALNEAISQELRKYVQTHDNTQFFQSVSLRTEEYRSPGLVVGTQLDLGLYGRYELYIGYDLNDSQKTLVFIQQTLVVAGIILILFIGIIAWFVVRYVVEPIRVAAKTSEKFARGDLSVRIPEQGQDVVASLAHSYNKMAQALQQQFEKLAELSQMQQRFVSDVSHELRTPLTTIRLAGGVLYENRDEFSAESARTTELLYTQIERFESLLTELLEISRYDAGAVVLTLELTNLVRVAREIAENLEPIALQNNVRVEILGDENLELIDVDVRRIRRIIANLLGNAIEHGDEKPVQVTVASNDEAVALGVRDNGVGMTEESLAHVFDRFWRADPSRKRTLGGTGLGLAISREDALVHGGTLEVWSRLHEGSYFLLTLPRNPDGVVQHCPLPRGMENLSKSLGRSRPDSQDES